MSATNIYPGMRVGVFHSASPDSFALYGFGVYTGEEVPSADAIIPGVGMPGMLGIPVPKLLLDDGTVIWGGEAHWLPESEVLDCPGREITVVKIEDARRLIQDAWIKASLEIEEIESSLPDTPEPGASIPPLPSASAEPARTGRDYQHADSRPGPC